MRSPIRKFRLNSPFDKEKSRFIISMFMETKSLVMVMRAFRKKFFPKAPKSVPGKSSFMRLLQRFDTETSVRPVSPLGPDLVPPEDIVLVKEYFKQNKQAHIRQAVSDLGLSYGKIWGIFCVRI
jgi:hypothetical protein